MEYLEFIRLCDQHAEPPIPKEHCLSHSEIHELIRERLSSAKALFMKRSQLIRKRLAIEKVKNSRFSSTYIKILNTLVNALRNPTERFDIETQPEAWGEVISLILKNRATLNYFATTDETHSANDLEFAEAYVGLSTVGIEFKEIDNEIFISDSSLGRADEIIDLYCRSIGGDRLLQWVFGILAPGYDNETGRLLTLNKLKINGKLKIADEAYGYMIALGAKYLSIKGNNSIDSAEIQLAIFCRDLTTILEVQDYSIWQTIHYPPELFIKGLQRIVWYDSIIDFRQMKAAHARKLLDFFSAPFKAKNLRINGVTLDHICKIATALIQLSNTKSTTILEVEAIARKSKVPPYIVTKALENNLSLPPRDINTELSFPLKSVSVNYNFRPAVSLSRKYLLYPRSITAAATVNAVINGIVYPNGERIEEHSRAMGVVLEECIRREFVRLGAAIAYGTQYNKNLTPDFESDLIVETTDSVIILESKKKDLTRKAMSGDEVSLLTDLADSLIHSQAQASRIEYELKNRPTLCLLHNNTERKISLNGRKVFKISVSLNDFGAFQDKSILARTLSHACLSNLAHPDAVENERLNKWRQHTSQLKKFALNQLPENAPVASAFHDSFFMSASQLFTMLEDSKTADDFRKTLGILGVMIYGKRNFYREWPHHRRIRDADSSAPNTRVSIEPS